jgi:hypothetical protein
VLMSRRTTSLKKCTASAAWLQGAAAGKRFAQADHRSI